MEKVPCLQKSVLVAIVMLNLSLALFASMFFITATKAQQHELMQFEWPIVGGNAQHTGFSSGPAPDTADILWKRNLGFPFAYHTFVAVFSGKVFVVRGSSAPFPPHTLFALDAFTGKTVWSQVLPFPSVLPFTHTLYKVDDEFMIVETVGGLMCFRINDGTPAWTYIYGNYSNPAEGNYWNGQFVPELKMKYGINSSGPALDNYVIALNLSDPSRPPTRAWQYRIDEGSEVLCYGDGKVFVGTAQWNIYALDALTGQFVWRAPKLGIASYSATFHRGILYHSSGSNRLTAYNASTGKMLWDYYAGGRAFFAFGGCAAYGKYFQHNIEIPFSYVAAWDAVKGTLLWKYPNATYGIGYLIPVVADGKVYVTTGDATHLGTIVAEKKFTCFDAFSGAVIWQYPAMLPGPAIAYGNLYGIDNDGTVYCFGGSPKPWSMFRGNPETPGVIEGQSGPSTLNVKWKYLTGGPVTSSPAVVDGKVYVGSHDQYLYCLNARNGSFIWKFKVNAKIRSSPAVVGGRVFTGADDGNIYCIDANNGTQIWKRFAGGNLSIVFTPIFQPRSSPIIVDDAIYVGSLDGKVYSLDTFDGRILWTYPTGRPIGGSPAIANGVVYIASTNNYTYALNASTGALIWRTLMPFEPSFGRPPLYFIGSPVVAKGVVYIPGGTDNPVGYRLFALNATDGNIIWKTVTWSHEAVAVYPVYSPTYVDGVLYLPEGFYGAAYNATDGTRIWQQWLGFQSFTSPAFAQGKVYFGTDIYSVQCLDASTGTPLSVYTTMGHIHSSPAIWEGKLYVGSADSNVYCFSDFPTITTSITIALGKNEINLTQSLTGCGQLSPQIPNAPITVTFARPNGTLVDLHVTTLENGGFDFTYTPDVAGNWTVTAWWNGAELKTHTYTYAFSQDLPLKVSGAGQAPPPTETVVPVEYVYAAAAIIIIAIIAVAGYMYMKRPKK